MWKRSELNTSKSQSNYTFLNIFKFLISNKILDLQQRPEESEDEEEVSPKEKFHCGFIDKATGTTCKAIKDTRKDLQDHQRIHDDKQ